MSRMIWLALAVMVAATVVGISLRQQQPAVPAAPANAPVPVVHRAALELTAEGMTPYRIKAPKDSEVHLLIRCAPGAAEGLLALTGYQDRVGPVEVGPGLSREVVFVADRPGDDFAFVLGERVLGRLHVTGSHLEPGHQ